jgi:hypothetical protein
MSSRMRRISLSGGRKLPAREPRAGRIRGDRPARIGEPPVGDFSFIARHRSSRAEQAESEGLIERRRARRSYAWSKAGLPRAAVRPGWCLVTMTSAHF